MEWHLLGYDHFPKASNRIKIHDYGSVSIPPLARLKDWVKQSITVAPDLRIVANAFIAHQLGFTDKGPTLIVRNNGVDPQLLQPPTTIDPKANRFLYVGSMIPQRQLAPFLQHFATHLTTCELHLVGTPSNQLYQQFHSYPNIVFIGKKNYWEMASLLQQASFGVNYIPDRYPFNQQISTKLLEYCAANLKIITTNYDWVRQFEQANGGHFFKLASDCSNLTLDQIQTFDFKTPKANISSWDEVIESSGIWRFIQQNLH